MIKNLISSLLPENKGKSPTAEKKPVLLLLLHLATLLLLPQLATLLLLLHLATLLLLPHLATLLLLPRLATTSLQTRSKLLTSIKVALNFCKLQVVLKVRALCQILFALGSLFPNVPCQVLFANLHGLCRGPYNGECPWLLHKVGYALVSQL